jgi:hypothetical protein
MLRAGRDNFRVLWYGTDIMSATDDSFMTDEGREMLE